MWVAFVDLLEDVDFEFGGIAVLFHVLDDLESDGHVSAFQIATLDHFSERPLAQLTHDLV